MAPRIKYACTKCGQEKAKKDFCARPENANGLDCWCRECKKEYQRVYVAARRKDPIWKAKANLAQRKSSVGKYGIGDHEFQKMMEVQGGRCAGCGNPPPPGRRLDIDHAHLPNEKKREPWERAPLVRGLLCYRCNRALGLLRDNAQTFQNLANYITSPPAVPIVKEMMLRLMDYLTNPPAQQAIKALETKGNTCISTQPNSLSTSAVTRAGSSR